MRVLESFPEPGPETNPYVQQLLQRLRLRADVRTFRWRDALVWDYDVFHVHWPESLIRQRRQRTAAGRTLAPVTNRLALLALLARLRVRGTPVVATRHNLAAHEPLRAVDRVLVAALLRRTAVTIRLNPCTPALGRTATIPHGHYRDWFAGRPTPDPVPGRVVFLGHLRPYKGVEQLVAAFRALPDPGLRLRIVGKPGLPRFADDLRQAAAADTRISTVLRFVDEDTMLAEVGAASLVVLPYPRMHNSGVALLALSLDRPVLVADNDVNRALAGEVGPGWVRLFTPPLDAAQLRAALDQPGPVSGSPDLRERDWDRAGPAHLAAFSAALHR